jgi:hypothetical protein
MGKNSLILKKNIPTIWQVRYDSSGWFQVSIEIDIRD